MMTEGVDAHPFFDSGFFSSLFIDASHRWVSKDLVFSMLIGGWEEVGLGLTFFVVIAQLFKKP